MDSLGRIRVITHPDVSDIFPLTRKVGEKKVFSLTSYFLHFRFVIQSTDVTQFWLVWLADVIIVFHGQVVLLIFYLPNNTVF